LFDLGAERTNFALGLAEFVAEFNNARRHFLIDLGLAKSVFANGASELVHGERAVRWRQRTSRLWRRYCHSRIVEHCGFHSNLLFVCFFALPVKSSAQEPAEVFDPLRQDNVPIESRHDVATALLRPTLRIPWLVEDFAHLLA
jgi:hypothetical protein